MKYKHLILGVVLLAIVVSTTTFYGRGFGGGHGGGGFGGMGGGGGGGFHGGGYGGGGMGGGGYGGGGMGGGGFRGGGMGGGEIHAYSGGSTPGFAADRGFSGAAGSFRDDGSRGNAASQLTNYAGDVPDTSRVASEGLPTDMGTHSEGSAFGYSGSARGLTAVDDKSFDREVTQSFAALGNEISAIEGNAKAEVDREQRPSGSIGARNVFAGQGQSVKPGNAAAAARVAAEPTANRANDNTGARAETAGRDVISHANNTATTSGAARATIANGREANGLRNGSLTRHLSPADLHVLGNKIRHDYVNPNDQNWYNSWGGVWLAAQAGAYSPWSPASWSTVNSWFGTNSPAISYDYGDELTYDGGNVSYNGRPIATAAQYWQSAKDLATQGHQAPPKDAQWLPLGVFAAIRGDDKSTDMVFQLAVAKDATIRGNYFNRSAKNTQPIEGAVDKKTERITWFVEDRKDILFDTGLYNLTKDETTLLVHFGKDKTEQWTLVRLEQKPNGSTKQ